MLLKNKLDKLRKTLSNNNVLTTLEERYCYAKDASNTKSKYKIPDLVIFVETIEDVQNILKYANAHSIPVIARGAGTNMVGACVCNEGGIVLNFSKMNKILDINPTNMTSRVQPGVVLEDLKQKVEEKGLFYPPDPSNYKVSTIGGSIAQSSGGAKSFKYGTTKDYILSLKVVTADGKLMTLGAETTKNSVGYHLAQLITGSEGTLAIVVEAVLKLIPKPESSSVVLAYFSDFETAVNATTSIISSGIYPSAIDFMDKNSMQTVEDFLHCGLKCNNECVLLIDIEGPTCTITEQCKSVKKVLLNSGANDIILPETEKEAETIWRARRASFAAATRLAPDVVSDDIIVPRDKVYKMISFCNATAKKYSLNLCLVGHLGDGNIHPQFALNLDDEKDFRNYQAAKSEIYNYTNTLGGSISAEHGVGLEKLPYLKNTIDNNSIEYMQMIKKSFDPNNILNPGKIFNL